MKMRKIISLLATVSMLAASFGSIAYAAESTDANVVIKVDVQSPEDYAGTINDVPEKAGYVPYLVSYKVTGIDANTYQLRSMTVGYSVSDEDKAKIEESTFKNAVTTGPASKRAKNGVYYALEAPQTVSAKQFAITFSAADPYDGTDYTETAVTQNIITTIWYVAEGEQVTVNYLLTDTMEDSLIVTSPWDDASDFHQYYKSNLSFDKPSITLGEAGGNDEYAFSAGTENVYADGIVWAGASMTNYNTTANEYWAEFTATGVTEPRKTLIRNLPESEKGTITFDAVMWFAGEAKTGVTFDINEYAIAE